MNTGTIKALKDFFGFITPAEGGNDLFFHGSELQGEEFEALQEGMTVSYEMTPGRDGRMQAVNVSISAAAPAASSDGSSDAGEMTEEAPAMEASAE